MTGFSGKGSNFVLSVKKIDDMGNLLNLLRVVAWIEGVTYLLLGITMPLKYSMDMPGPNYIVGTLHGIFFLLYITLVAAVSFRDKWDRKTTFLALAASLIPFGTFWAEKKLFRYGLSVKD